MHSAFATAYSRIIGIQGEGIHKAVQNHDTHDWDILLHPGFRAYWEYDHETVQYVASLWAAEHKTVDLDTLGKMVTWDTVTTARLSVEGIRLMVTVSPRGDDLHLRVRGSHSQYDDMLEMVFMLSTRTSMVEGLYPGTILKVQGIASPGNFLLSLVDRFNILFGMDSSRLYDISKKVMCHGTSAVSVPLQQLFLLARGSSWYMGHGFLPRDDNENFDITCETDQKRTDLERIRATSMRHLYGEDESLEVLVLSGLPIEGNRREYTSTLLTGHFFELLLQHLFASNKRACGGILAILDKTEAVLAHRGYAIQSFDFVKRYDRVDVLPSRRIQRRH
jgi:hypothetical protein